MVRLQSVEDIIIIASQIYDKVFQLSVSGMKLYSEKYLNSEET